MHELTKYKAWRSNLPSRRRDCRSLLNHWCRIWWRHGRYRQQWPEIAQSRGNGLGHDLGTALDHVNMQREAQARAYRRSQQSDLLQAMFGRNGESPILS